jgi:2-amino-4-hydroxy-6-hydroxymethyldihydropteridine diphosphokinase
LRHNIGFMKNVYLLTGGNIGNREQNLLTAVHLLGQHCGQVLQRSSVYETAPWGKNDQANFYNQVLLIETMLQPMELLNKTLLVEEMMGRLREEKNGPRTIDIDILFYDDLILSTPSLEIPHPRIQFRRFVLTPLNEIAPGFVHPVLKKTVGDLLADCTDPLTAFKI